MEKLFQPQSFTDKDLQRAEKIARRAIFKVAPTLRQNYGSALYDTKLNARDWVTTWDRWAEDVIKTELAAFSPDIGFCAEESSGNDPGDVYWTIDSIDATSHFVRGMPFCATMLGLVDHGTPVSASICNFISQQWFTATAGKGAFHNFGYQLHVSDRPIDTSYLELYTREDTLDGLALRLAVEKTGAYLLRTAATGHTFVTISRGATEGLMAVNNPYGSEWDLAPGSLLVHEAGGMVRNIGSTGFSCKNFDFIAANAQVFPVLERIAERQAA